MNRSLHFLRTFFALLVLALPALLQAQDPAPTRILPLGDSITYGRSLPVTYSGYRDLLQALLVDTGYNPDFVGTQIDTENSLIPDPHHEGHRGFRIDQIASEVDTWLSRVDDPDVVLLMIGTNDFLQGHQTAQATARLEALIAQIATARPHARIIVSNLVRHTANPSIETAQVNFNAAIPGIVQNQVANGRDVSYVDMHSVLTASDISSDGIHPAESGYDKMANAWFDSILPLIAPTGTNKPPAIARVTVVTPQRVDVTFSKPVEDAAALISRYGISGGVAISAAVLDTPAKRTVSLTTSSLAPDTNYTLTVTGVRDRTPASLTIAPGSTASFTTPIISNGSFEYDLTAWNVAGNVQIVSDTERYMRDGRRTVVLNGGQGTPNGTLTQTFTTVPGRAYRLDYAQGVLAFNTSQQRIQATVTGNGTLATQTVSITGQSGGRVTWANRTLGFVADGTTATLTLSDVSTTSTSIDLLLDHVRVSAVASRTLTVQSTPDLGVPVTVTPTDLNGLGSGNTALTRQFNDGTAVTLTAPALYAGRAFQKWQRNGADYDTNTSTSVTMNGNHTLVAVYVSGGPVISTDPLDLTATVGATATFSVTASGSPPVSYQWRQDGQPLSGATESSLSISNVQTTNAGLYDVVVTNGSGSVVSNAAELTVIASGGLSNGSFESAFDAWTISGNLVTGTGTKLAPRDGDAVTILNGGQSTPNGIVAQRVTTVVGQTYQLQFDYGVYAFNTSQQRVRVDVVGTSTLSSQTLSLTGQNNGARWASASVSFTADSDITMLRFTDVSTTSSNIDLMLDNVRLVANNAPRTLTVNATVSDVTITVSPTDTSGNGNGTAPLIRTYAPGTLVTLTAPATAQGNAFLRWQVDGADQGGNTTVNVTMSSDRSVTAVYATPVLLTNGSFEADFAGWNLAGNAVIASSAPYIATDGTRLAVLNGGNSAPNAVLSQTFSTTPGQSYSVLFDLGTRGFNRNVQRLQVTVMGTTTRLSQATSITATGSGNLVWSARAYSFTADSTTTTLTFQDISATTDGLDLLLDRVRVTQ